MTDPAMLLPDENRLRMIDLEATPIPDPGASGGVPMGDWVRRYLEEFPPGAALRLLHETRQLRDALGGVIAILERNGYSRDSFATLDEAERNSDDWVAVQQCWSLTEPRPSFLLRVSRGEVTTEVAFPSREEALAAAIESLEMLNGYPEAILLPDGQSVMNCAEILRAWEERHDPG
jgi:hypothetical protein